MLNNYVQDIKVVKNEIKEIANGLLKANELILDALGDCDKDKFTEVKSHIKNITTKTDHIDNSVVKLLALYAPEARDLREVVAYLKITNEILRACTSTRSFTRGLYEVCESMDLSVIKEYAMPLQASALKAIKVTVQMFDIECTDELQDCFNEVLIEENKTDDLYELLEKSILNNTSKKDGFEKIHTILRAFRKSEKIADRAISIANLLVYVKVGGTMQRV